MQVYWVEQVGGVGGGGSVGCFGGGVGSGWCGCDDSGVVCDCFFWGVCGVVYESVCVRGVWKYSILPGYYA